MSMLLCALLLGASRAGPEPSQTNAMTAPVSLHAARQDDVATPRALVDALYEVISAPAGTDRDWGRFLSLFIPDARLTSASASATTDVATIVTLTPDEYVTRHATQFRQRGFRERELAFRVQVYGNVAHAFSAYESRRDESPAHPPVRGINSLDFVSDGHRWWIASISWTGETSQNPLSLVFPELHDKRTR